MELSLRPEAARRKPVLNEKGQEAIDVDAL